MPHYVRYIYIMAHGKNIKRNFRKAAAVVVFFLSLAVAGQGAYTVRRNTGREEIQEVS